MSNQNENADVNNIEFGVVDQNITEMTADEQEMLERYRQTCYVVGCSTMEWATYATREDYIAHMLELYDSIHSEQGDQSGLILPQ